jgi:hypothetical protein
MIVRVMHDVFLNGDSCVHIDRMGSQQWQAHGLGHVYNPTPADDSAVADQPTGKGLHR